MSDAEVLVVGAGPTGLMLANQLARAGVRPVIVDRHAGPSVETRALGVQARTLEIYAHLGIAERAVALGHRTMVANMWADGHRAARVPLGDIGRGVSPYPFVLILGQDDNERLLRESLATHGITVEWNTELVGLAQDGEGATAELRAPDGTSRRLRASWVAGCDGARSAVRELNHIPFVGEAYEHVFFVADVVATGSMGAGELNVYLWKDGFHLFFPMRGTNHWRVVGILPPELRGRDDVTFDDVVPSITHEAGAGLRFDTCSWFSTYRIHHRRAERFRAGRCFLLGDAAHIHSPVGAQGMNTGLQDAYNLGWKLARVVDGRAAASLLDSYPEERIPVATRLLETTDRAFEVIVLDNRVAGLLRTWLAPRLFALAMRFEAVRQLAFRTIAQTGIEYRGGTLSQDEPGLSEGGPRAGDRFPWMNLQLSEGGSPEDLFARLDDTRFNLLVFGPQAADIAAAGLGPDVAVLRIPMNEANAVAAKRAAIALPAYYLLRPDCHVGLAGRTLVPARVRTYLGNLAS